MKTKIISISIIVLLSSICIWSCQPIKLSNSVDSSPIPTNPTSGDLANTDVLPDTNPVVTEGTVRYIPYNESEWKLLFPNASSPDCIVIDSKGKSWAILNDQLSYYEDGSWLTISINMDNTSVFGSILLSKDDTLWMFIKSDSHSYLAHFSNNYWDLYDLPSGYELKNTYSAAIDSKNRIWIVDSNCSSKECVFRFDGSSWQAIEMPASMSFSSGSRIFSDSHGNIWIDGGFTSGIALYYDPGWQVYTGNELWPDTPFINQEKPLNNISLTAGQDGTLWAFLDSTPILVQITSDGKIMRFPIELGIDLTNVSYLVMYAAKDNALWLGTYHYVNGNNPHALGFFDGEQWAIFTGLPFSYISEITESSEGKILVFTETGTYLYSPNQ